MKGISFFMSQKDHLHKAQDRMKGFADRRGGEVQFQVGDQVFLKMQPYRFRSLVTRQNEKLSPYFYEPHKVLEKIGTTTYHLLLPPTTKIHSIFHVS